MNHTKLRFLALLLAVIMCLGLVACSQNTDEPSDTVPATDAGTPQDTTNPNGDSENQNSSGNNNNSGNSGNNNSGNTGDNGNTQPGTSSDKLVNKGTDTDGSFYGWNDFEGQKSTVDTSRKLVDYLDYIKVVGRSEVVDDGITCDFTASGMEFNVTTQGAVQLSVTATADTYFTVFVDAQRSETRFLAKAGTSTLTIANFATQGTHHIRVLKQTEPQNSLCVLNSLKFDGKFETKPADKDLYIEFLGDSISCGYGNMCANGAENPGNALNQDGTQAYAFLTAEALGADCSVISCSGIGVAKGYRTFTMDTFFSKQSYYRSNTKAYTKTRTPDIVVINLGTNDQSQKASESEFIAKAKALIELIHTTYGDVPIIWAHGMMKDGMSAQIAAVAAELTSTGTEIYTVKVLESFNNAGGNGHPNLEAHTTATTNLKKFIEDNILTQN